jgi:hypothetical protein
MSRWRDAWPVRIYNSVYQNHLLQCTSHTDHECHVDRRNRTSSWAAADACLVPLKREMMAHSMELYSDDPVEPFDWKCPLCGQNATITEERYSKAAHHLDLPTSEGDRMFITEFVVCPNRQCRKIVLSGLLHEVEHHEGGRQSLGKCLKRWRLIPASHAQSFPTYIPKPILDDYNEACLIRELSPKASATLSRRALQGIIRDFWQVKAGRLMNEIAAIKAQVDPAHLGGD